MSEAAAFLLILNKRCFSIDASIRFSSGGITSASESTPTIRAVWNMPKRLEKATKILFGVEETNSFYVTCILSKKDKFLSKSFNSDALPRKYK